MFWLQRNPVNMATNQEERNKKLKAALVTTGVNAGILLILLFAAAWKMPGEGPGDYPGIEVNLGYDDQGTGDIEPMTPIGEENATDTENPGGEPVEEVDNEVESEAAEETPTVLPEATVTDPNSDVEIKEPEKKVEPVEKVESKKPPVKTEVPVVKPVEKKVEEKPKAVYKPSTTTNPTTTTTDAGTGTGKEGTAGNQGDDVGKEGNKGVEGGTPGANVYKGTPGGGDGGTGLDLNGWNWDYIPKPAVPDGETGRVVFQIEVDENGELIGYRKESGTVSSAAERACVAALSKLTFTKKAGAKVPEVSKGKITFVIRAQ